MVLRIDCAQLGGCFLEISYAVIVRQLVGLESPTGLTGPHSHMSDNSSVLPYTSFSEEQPGLLKSPRGSSELQEKWTESICSKAEAEAFLFIYIYFWLHLWHVWVFGPGMNPSNACYSSNPNCFSDNASQILYLLCHKGTPKLRLFITYPWRPRTSFSLNSIGQCKSLKLDQIQRKGN